MESPFDTASDTPVSKGDSWSTIGKYHVLEKLSEGGQAIVFRVVHPTLRKELALKLCKSPVRCSESERHEIVTEGRLLADLDHAGLSRIYDVDFEGDRPFLVMEYIRGRNLRQQMRERKLSTDEALHLMTQVSHAVAAAHRAGITHRDLKPENIVIDVGGNPRVIDFGLAILRHGCSPEPNTAPSLSGTVRYMAPEQARCEVAEVGARTDVFALGAILFELLTGQPLNSGDGVNGMLRQAREGQFDRSALELASVPARVQSVCDKATAAAATERYGDAGQFADSLQAGASSGRRKQTKRMLVVIAVVVAGLFGVFALNQQQSQPAALQELIEVRAPRVASVSQMLPLQNGDRIRVECETTADVVPHILWFDTTGKLESIPCTTLPVEPDSGVGQRVVAFDGESTLTIVGAPGTELVIIAGHPDESAVAQVLQELLGTEPWPELPANVCVLMSIDRVEVKIDATLESRGIEVAEDDPTQRVKARLEAIRQNLSSRGFRLAHAIAFPHKSGSR